MAINKLVLERDGLVVGNTQLVASGEGVSVGSLGVTGDASFTGGVVFSGNVVFSSNVSMANSTSTNFYVPGTIVQANNTYLTSPFSYSIPASTSTYTDIPGLSVKITPKSLRSKIYILARVFGEYNPQTVNWETMYAIRRNFVAVNLPPQPGSVAIGHHMASLSYLADNADSTPELCFFDMFDTPNSTNTITYSVSTCSGTASTHFINRCVGATTTAGYERGTSSITVFEIAQ